MASQKAEFIKVSNVADIPPGQRPSSWMTARSRLPPPQIAKLGMQERELQPGAIGLLLNKRIEIADVRFGPCDLGAVVERRQIDAREGT